MIKIQPTGATAFIRSGVKPVSSRKFRGSPGEGSKDLIFESASGRLRVIRRDQRIEASFTPDTDVYVRSIAVRFRFRHAHAGGKTLIWAESPADRFPVGRAVPVPGSLSHLPVTGGGWALWVSDSTDEDGLFFSQSPPAGRPVLFRCDPRRRTVEFIWELNRNMTAGTAVEMTRIEIRSGALDRLLREWRRSWAPAMKREIAADRRTGWCGSSEIASPKELRDVLTSIKSTKARMDWFAIGPEYASATGDWLTPGEPFRDRMGSVSRSIGEYGFNAGIRFAPFLVSRRSTLATEKRDWLVRSSNGTPLFVAPYGRDRDSACVLDVTRTEVIDHLSRMLSVMRDQWGFRSFVLERVGDAAVAGYRKNPATGSDDLVRIAAETLRAAAGNKVFLAASGVPFLAACGQWDSPAMIDASMVCATRNRRTREAETAALASALLHRSLWREADLQPWSGPIPVALLEGTAGRSNDTFLKALAMSAGTVSFIGDPRNLGDSSVAALKAFLDLFNQCRKGRHRLLLNVGAGRTTPLMIRSERGILALFNFSSRKRGALLNRDALKSDLGVSSTLSAGDGAVFNSPEIHVALPPYGHRIFRS